MRGPKRERRIKAHNFAQQDNVLSSDNEQTDSLLRKFSSMVYALDGIFKDEISCGRVSEDNLRIQLQHTLTELIIRPQYTHDFAPVS